MNTKKQNREDREMFPINQITFRVKTTFQEKPYKGEYKRITKSLKVSILIMEGKNDFQKL